ncbi:MAG: alanine dehydrogenase [Paracoccaceae bacterium]
MIIGVPKEIKAQEYRVALTPKLVGQLTAIGHRVLVECAAGGGSGFDDELYVAAGAEILGSAAELFERAELIVKVKEPQAVEIAMLRAGQILFAYLHLAPDRRLVEGLLTSGVTAIAFETVRDASGRLPLLFPMSEIAGRVAAQAAAYCLEKTHGGAGVLLSGASGVSPGLVLVLGGGVVGLNAATIARGMGARVVILESSADKREQLQRDYGGQFETLPSNRDVLERYLHDCDVIIGAALVPGDTSPRLLSRPDLRIMKNGAVLVDVAIDQGGCFESSRATSHDDPTYIEEGVVHYCVANMPGAVPRTATTALAAAIFPYVSGLAERGWRAALAADQGFAAGLSLSGGDLHCPAVARAQGRPVADAKQLLLPA